MFHLLVKFQGWPESAGTIPTSRVYIKPDKAPGNQFFSGDKLEIEKILRYPALLVTETGGQGLQYARVARIINLRQGPSETDIEYSDEVGIPKISNEDLELFATQIGITTGNLTHTHWQICDADIFKILLKNKMAHSVKPKVFSIDENNIQDRDLVSVMMPFKAEFDKVHSKLKETISSLGFTLKRADDIWDNHSIIQDIVSLISKSKVVICDFSERNPNVFYEAGIAHTLGKEVIIIAQSEGDVPFDLRHLRYIRYLANEEGLNKLSIAVKDRLKNILGIA